MICPNCGNINNNSDYCLYCGMYLNNNNSVRWSMLNQNDQNALWNEFQSKNKKFPFYYLFIVALIAVLIWFVISAEEASGDAAGGYGFGFVFVIMPFMAIMITLFFVFKKRYNNRVKMNNSYFSNFLASKNTFYDTTSQNNSEFYYQGIQTHNNGFNNINDYNYIFSNRNIQTFYYDNKGALVRYSFFNVLSKFWILGIVVNFLLTSINVESYSKETSMMYLSAYFLYASIFVSIVSYVIKKKAYNKMRNYFFVNLLKENSNLYMEKYEDLFEKFLISVRKNKNK